MAPRVRLPQARRPRLLVALAGYLVATAVGAAVLTTLSQGLGGILLSVGWTVVLLVPLAVVATPPRQDRPPGPQDHLPLLMRSKPERPGASS